LELSTDKILEEDEITFQQANKTQSQIYSGVAYQEDSECSRVAELQFLLKSTWKSIARPENGCLTMINNELTALEEF
jgi:hypothetical protein